MEKVLVYVGLNNGRSFSDYIDKGYTKMIGIEAMPEKVKILKDKYKNNSKIEIIGGALTDKTQEYIDFYVIKNIHNPQDEEDSSSCGLIKENNFFNKRAQTQGDFFKVVETIKVKTLNLKTILDERNITNIHTYVSDLEGNDLTVLKTIDHLIKEKRINYIQIETEEDWVPEQIHSNIASNKQSEIIEYLKDYEIFKYQSGNFGPSYQDMDRWIHRDLFLKLPGLEDLNYLHS